MNAMSRRLLAVLYAVFAAVSVPVSAQTYPSQPVRVVVPYPPGGSTDILARLLAQSLSKGLGQSVVVDNRPGANGGIGAGLVARAAPDGHTLLLGNGATNGINHSVYKDLPYDTVRDFAPVSPFAIVPFILVVPVSSPVTSVSELIKYERARAGKLHFASVGIGSGSHVTGEMFNALAGTQFAHVPYKGGAQAIPATIAGDVAFFFATGLEGIPQIKNGRLRALGIATKTRSAMLPETPTIAESGLPGFESNVWFGLLAPAGTPHAVVDRLNREVGVALAEEAVRKRLTELSSEPFYLSADAFSALVKADIAKWAKVVKASGAKSD